MSTFPIRPLSTQTAPSQASELEQLLGEIRACRMNPGPCCRRALLRAS
ncbi:MAG: hypothetical protein WAS90_12725 [Brachymonas denitrificans]